MAWSSGGCTERRRYSENRKKFGEMRAPVTRSGFCSAGAIQVCVFRSRDALEGAGLALPVGEVSRNWQGRAR